MKENIGDFLSYLEYEKGCSKNTLEAYQSDLNLFFDFQKGKKLQRIEDIRTKDIRRFLVFLAEERGNKQSSISRRITSLKTFFKFLKEEEIIHVDPSEKIGSPKRTKSLPEFLTLEETQKLLDLDKPLLHQAILEVIYATGCRVSEAANLNLEEIKLEKLSIMIRDGKGGKDRPVMITLRAKKVLEEYLTRDLTKEELTEKGIDTHYMSRKEKINYLKKIGRFIPGISEKAVFLGRSGGRIRVRTIQGFIGTGGKKVGIKVSPHKLRHSMASHLTMSGLNIRVLQKLLGHSSLATTQIYASVTLDHIKDEYQDKFPIQ